MRSPSVLELGHHDQLVTAKSHVKSKKENEWTKSKIRPINTRNKLMVAGEWERGALGKMGEEEQEIQASTHGMNKSQE